MLYMFSGGVGLESRHYGTAEFMVVRLCVKCVKKRGWKENEGQAGT